MRGNCVAVLQRSLGAAPLYRLPMHEIDPTPTVGFTRLEVQIGTELLSLARPEPAGAANSLLEAVPEIRKNVADLTGLILGPVRIRDNRELPTNGYAILIDEVPKETGTVVPDGLLLLKQQPDQTPLRDPNVTEPVFGLPGRWISRAEYERPSSTTSINFVETVDGVGYVSSSDGPYDPASDLLLVSMEIAAAIEVTDPDYRARPFTIGQETSPTYWLSSHDLDVATIEKDVVSAVQFRATIAPDKAKYQTFVVDIYEFNTADTVKRLQAVADTQAIDESAILAVSHENIFCIIGTRTHLMGGKTYETNKSLQRFRPKIEAAIKAIIHNPTR